MTPSDDKASLREARELLPCPFCGGKAEASGFVWHWYVRCVDADCFASTHGSHYLELGDAIAAWNRRVTFIERTAATEPQVTEEMVERFCAHNHATWWFRPDLEADRRECRKIARASLLAALSGKDQP